MSNLSPEYKHTFVLRSLTYFSFVLLIISALIFINADLDMIEALVLFGLNIAFNVYSIHRMNESKKTVETDIVVNIQFWLILIGSIINILLSIAAIFVSQKLTPEIFEALSRFNYLVLLIIMPVVLEGVLLYKKHKWITLLN